ncbi:MAG: ATP-binding protein [Paludibacter sp.]|nr:ATP-binding protein [Paludibacter sp.]
MFKSIQYRLTIYICLLIVSVAATTAFAMQSRPMESLISGIIVLIALYNLWKHNKRYNQNILFLLNALENGDYSFHFSETNLSRREKELNLMLNRIKDILTNARKAVIENEKFLSLIVESVSTGIIIVDEKSHVQTVNRAALDLLGLPVFTHLNQLSVINESFPLLFKGIMPEDNLQISIPNEKEEIQISLRMSEINLKEGKVKIITLNNIGSELETKEIESWVRLIRVMTHEIMNSIAPITSLSETLLSFYKKTDMDRDEAISLRNNTIEAFETIHSTARGLLSFVESYRKFTSVPKPKIEPLLIRPLIDKVIHLESQVIEQNQVNVQIQAVDNTTTIQADEKLIFQVLINIIKNALEAIPLHDGNLIIRYGKQMPDKVFIEVCNNGQPIPADVLPNIFIPFFTTKENGSGIGLSVSRYIMRLHGGKLIHTTSPEGWTIFKMSC